MNLWYLICEIFVDKVFMSKKSIHLFRLLLFVTKALVKNIWDSPGLSGLSGPQFGVLRVLDNSGPLTPSELSETMLVSAANVTGLVSRLKKLGFVERRRQASDRRSLKIVLSHAGQEALGRITPLWECEVARCFRPLNPREKRELTVLLDKFADAFPKNRFFRRQPEEDSA